MIRLVALLIFLLAAGAASGKDAVPLAQDPVVEQRMIAISEEMRCLVCQNESLAGSRADLAEDLRRQLRELIRQGKSDQEIKAYMVSRYGDFVLYRPPVKPTTWLLWAGPFALMFTGVAALLAGLFACSADRAVTGRAGAFRAGQPACRCAAWRSRG